MSSLVLSPQVIEMHNLWPMARVTINITPELEIAFNFWFWQVAKHLCLITHYPYRLHAPIYSISKLTYNWKNKEINSHKHMLQDMAMHHPNPWVFNSKSPRPPPRRRSVHRRLLISIQHCGIPLHRHIAL